MRFVYNAFVMFIKNKYFSTKKTEEFFDKNSPAYVVSNEDLRLVMNSLKPKAKDVLTVVGSGDQPLFFQLYDAKTIDTFDISINAKQMMDVKVAAIKALSYDDYYDVLKSIGAGSAEFPVKKTYISSYYMPLKSEYEALKTKVDKTYNFINSDIYSLHESLNRKYDIFYFSNILQYNFDAKKIVKLLNNLRPFMKKDTLTVLHIAPYFVIEELEGFSKIRNSIKKWADMNLIRDSAQTACIIKTL